MTSQRVERTWIRTGSYGRFSGEWVNNTKENFLWEPKKINVEFQKNGENMVKIWKMSCARCHFVKFDICFPRLP